MTTEPTELIHEPLLLPAAAISYHLSKRLHELYPDKALVEGSHDPFHSQGYARAGHCTLTIRPTPYPQLSGEWHGRLGVFYEAENL